MVVSSFIFWILLQKPNAFNEILIIYLSNKDSRVIRWCKSLLAQQGRESTQLAFHFGPYPPNFPLLLNLKPTNKTPQNEFPSFYPLSPPHPPDFPILPIAFSLIILCSLSLTWFFALPPDLLLILFNHIYNI